MKKIITFASILVLIVTAANAQNQSFTATQNAKLALSNAIDITFASTGNNVGTDVNLAFNNVNDYANGVESATYQVKVRSNKKFVVKAKASSNNFTYNGTTTPAPVMKVKNILFIKVSNNNTGGTVPNAVNNQFKTLKKNNRKLINNGTPGGNNTFDIQYKATPGFAFPAGTYSVDVVYTATQK